MALVAALAIAVVLLAIGWPAFGADVPGRTAPALVLAIVGALALHNSAGFARGDLGVVALWGAVGLVVALRRFSWLPRGR
jgi:hypothetical protein